MIYFSKNKRLKWLIPIPLLLLFLIIVWPYIPDNPADNVSPTGGEIANCQREFAPKYTRGPYYQGELFDAHFHLPAPPGSFSPFIKQAIMGVGKDVTINEIMCLFDKEKNRGALAFYIPRKTNKVRVPQAAEIKEYAKGRISLYISPIFLSPEELEQVLAENPGLFAGIGEIGYYETDKFVRPLNGSWSDKIFKIATRRNMPVMIHPGSNQQDQLEEVLRNNPQTFFLLHGYETERYIDSLMNKYNNIYFSVDSATLYALEGKLVRASRDEFVGEFKQNFNSLLNERVLFWKDIIARHPDRFMWGTDRGGVWHYEDELSSLMEEFARAFIGRLDKSVQEKYAYQNAEKFLGKVK